MKELVRTPEILLETSDGNRANHATSKESTPMMKAKKTALLLAMISLTAATARGEGSEGFADQPVARFGEAGRETIVMSERKDRLYWREVNGDLVIAYSGGVAAANAALKDFADAKGKGRDVILRPGPGRMTTFEGGIIKCDFSFHAPGKLGLVMLGAAKTKSGEPIFEAEPTMTIYIGEAVPLGKLNIPAGLRVLDLGDLRDHFVAGLSEGMPEPETEAIDKQTPEGRMRKTKATTVRAQSAYQLGSLGPIAAEVVVPLRSALKDPESYVRLCAISALGQLGTEAAKAVPDLEALSKVTKEDQEKTSITKAVDDIKNARPQPPEWAKDRIAEIHAFRVDRK